MNDIVESYAWCMAQVTLLSAAAAGVYLLLRLSQMSGRATLLAGALLAAIALTLASASPWPRWNWGGQELIADVVIGNVSSEANAISSQAPQIAFDASALTLKQVAESAESEEVALPVRPAAEAASPSWSILLVFGAWAACVVGMLRLAIGVVQLRRCRRQSVAVDDEELLKLMDELRVRYRIRRPVELRESSRLGVAATIGWLRPLVLLPPAWREWTADQRRAVLAHELAHVGERHFPAWIVGQLAVVAHFYHPLVHWLARRLRLEQELAADALAASVFADRRQYATVLATLALGPSRPQHLIAPLGLFMSRPLLMRRIAMLRQSNEPARSSSRRSRYFMLLVVALLCVGVAGLRAAADSESGGLPAPTDASQTIRVISLLQVSRGGGPMSDRSEAMSDAAWKTYCSTQLALVKSDWLLTAALEQHLRELPIIKSQAHPVAWLQANLRVGFLADSDIMYVMMYCSRDDADQVRKVVDAVVEAQESKVIYKDKQQKLLIIDALRKSLDLLNKQILRDTQNYLDWTRELGSSGVDGQMKQQIALKRLDRVDTELMRLEADTLEKRFNYKAKMEALEEQKKDRNDNGKAEIDKVQADLLRELKNQTELFEVRTSTLKRSKEELESTLDKVSEKSVDLIALTAKLEQNQQIAKELTMKLQRLELEADAPPLIQRVYGGSIATDAGSPPPTPPRPNAPR